MTGVERKRRHLLKQIEKLHERKAEGLEAEPELSQAYDELMRVEVMIKMGVSQEGELLAKGGNRSGISEENG